MSGGTAGKRMRIPGLTVDSAGEHAYIVEPDGSVADVDLHAHRVEYHFAVRAPASIAKGQVGTWATARWLGDGLVAITSGRSTRAGSGPIPFRFDWSGLELLDVRTWTRKLVDRGATLAVVAGGIVNVLTHADGCEDRLAVAGYARDGALRYRHCEGTPLGIVQSFEDSYLYVPLADQRVLVIDIASGNVIAQPQRTTFLPLVPDPDW